MTTAELSNLRAKLAQCEEVIAAPDTHPTIRARREAQREELQDAINEAERPGVTLVPKS